MGQGEIRDPGGVCREEQIVSRPLSGIVGIHLARLSPSCVSFGKQYSNGKLKRVQIKKKSCINSGPKPSHSSIHSFVHSVIY